MTTGESGKGPTQRELRPTQALHFTRSRAQRHLADSISSEYDQSGLARCLWLYLTPQGWRRISGTGSYLEPVSPQVVLPHKLNKVLGKVAAHVLFAAAHDQFPSLTRNQFLAITRI